MLKRQYPVVHLCPVGEDGKAEGCYVYIDKRNQPFRNFREPVQVREPVNRPAPVGADKGARG